MLSPTTSTNQKKIKNARCTKKIATSGRDPMTPVQTFLNLENVHATWVKFHHDTQTLHPLGPLVEAWQNRPRPAVRNKRTDRILPAGLGMIATPDRRAGSLFTPRTRLTGKKYCRASSGKSSAPRSPWPSMTWPRAKRRGEGAALRSRSVST